jgi:hypothetical protein
VMHPPSPIMSSDSLLIRSYFSIMLAVAIASGLFLTVWIRSRYSVETHER